MGIEKPKILVIGTGAIGGFYAAKLSQAGAEINVVCRSDYDFVKKNGIKIKSHWQKDEFHFRPKQVLKSAEEFKEEADFILVATKVLPEISISKLIKPALSKNSSIVLLQNGIHIEKEVAQTFPNHHLISILAFVCVSRIGSGHIHHQDYGRLVVGDFPKGLHQKTQALIDLFTKSGVPCEGSENVLKERWRKLVWNAPFNPISVLGGKLNTKEILEDEQNRELVKNVMLEVCHLAKIDGCELPENIAEKNIEDTLAMQPYKTSMLLDFEAGRKMEVEAILGNAVRFARSRSVDVPCLSQLYEKLKRIYQGR